MIILDNAVALFKAAIHLKNSEVITDVGNLIIELVQREIDNLACNSVVLNDEEKNLIKDGLKIQAIKRLRMRTNIQLLEAKKIVVKYAEDNFL